VRNDGIETKQKRLINQKRKSINLRFITKKKQIVSINKQEKIISSFIQVRPQCLLERKKSIL